MNIHLKPLIGSLVVVGLVAAPLASATANERIEERLSRLERVVDGGTLAEMVNQMEQLRRELQLVRGDLEVAQYELEDLKQRQRDLYQDNDRRLRQLETAIQAPADEPPTPAVPVPELSTDAADASARGGASEWETYQAAFNIMRAGRYAEASKAFADFLARYPDGRFQDNALYWLGESHYAVRNFDGALDFFQQIVSNMPGSNKHADAMLKIGYVHFERDEMERAREVLERLRREHPDSTAATLAAQRLELIRERSR